MLTTEASGLILNTALGLIKLGSRIDLLWAEKEALQKPLALPLATVALAPTQPQMRRALQQLLDETSSESPDPLGAERADIEDTVTSNPDNTLLFSYMQKYLPLQALGDVVNLEGTFVSDLRKARPDLAVDRDLVISAYFVGAGKDVRNKSYSWRLALTVVDTFADFGAENTALFIRDESVQTIVGSVLKRFGDAEVQTTDSTSALLRIVLTSTLNGVLDSRSDIEIDNVWLDALLDGLVAARASLPEAEQDNFIAGLLQGKGYPLLVGNLLEQGAGVLTGDDKQNFGDVAATFLQEVAVVIKQKPSFEDFFEDHWGDLLRAGFSSLEQHGPVLLNDADPLLTEVLVGVLGNLARSPNSKLLSRDMLTGIVDAAVSVVAANPDQVRDLVNQEWLGTLISSISTTLARQSVKEAFTKQGLEALVRDTLATFAEHPELIVGQPGLARDLLRDLLENLSAADSFSAGVLASAAVDSALRTMADHPELANTRYTGLVTALAGNLAGLVHDKRLGRVQASDLLGVAVAALADNPQLFLDIEQRFAGFVVDAAVKAADESQGLISGATLVQTVQSVLKAVARSGKAALNNHPAADLADQLEKVMTAGLARAEKELGNQMNMSDVPDVLGLLVESWARGELASLDPANDNFRRIFSNLISEIAA